jgi:ferritin-like metal-binding protein YciE
MAITTATDKFVYEVACLRNAEQRTREALLSAAAATQDTELSGLLRSHADETATQIDNLESILEMVGPSRKAPKSDTVQGLTFDLQKALRQVKAQPALASCLVAAAQSKGEALEIACYQGLIVGANAMGNADVVRLLEANLAQEQTALAALQALEPRLASEAIAAG